MTAKGHVVLAVAPLAAWFGPSLSEHTQLVAAAAIGALLPDIDEPGSYIGRRLPFVSVVLKGLGVEHRALTHRFWLVVALFAFAMLFWGDPGFGIWAGLAYGVLMHDVGDMLTRGGIKGFFWPFSDATVRLVPKRYAFYTGSPTEYLLVAVLLGIGAWPLLAEALHGVL